MYSYFIFQHLKVNTDPCLFADPVDLDLKSALITEMLNIVGFHIPEASGEGTLIQRMIVHSTYIHILINVGGCQVKGGVAETIIS